MLSAMRTLNPALSAYDPISPSGTQGLVKQPALPRLLRACFWAARWDLPQEERRWL